MATYQVSMPDGSAYHVEMPETNQPEQSFGDKTKNFLSNVGEAANYAVHNPKEVVDTIGKHSELGDIPNVDTAKALVKAPVYGAANIADTVAGYVAPKLGMDYASTDFHKNLDAANQTHEQELETTPYGQTANFIGQAGMTPVPEINLVGKAAKSASALAKAGKAVGRGAENIGKGAVVGAEFAADQPKPQTNNSQDLEKQSAETLETGAIAGGATNAALGAGNWFVRGTKYLTGGWFSDKVAKKGVGEYLNDLPQEQQQALTEHNTNPTAKDFTLTDVTQNRDIAGAENKVFKNEDKNALDVRRQGTNEKIAEDLSNLSVPNADTGAIKPAAQAEVGNQQSKIEFNTRPQQPFEHPEIQGAITPVQAQEKVGAAARDVSNSERQAIKDSYDAVAPDETVHAPIEELQPKLDATREKYHEAIHGNEEAGIMPDSMLSKIDNRYSGETEGGTTASVKQMIQDKNNLGDYVNGQYRVLKEKTLDYDQQQVIKQKIDAAQEMRDALKEHLGSLDDIPSGVEDKSVAEAFNDAENRYKGYRENFLENPEQFKVNEQGQSYNRSSSAFGDYDYRLQNRSAGGLAEEGKKLLPIENPDALSSNLKNLRNVPDSDGLVKSNLLAGIKEKGYDKVYTPEVKAVLESNGFGDVSKEIENIGNKFKSENFTIEQRNKLIEGVRQDEQSKLESTFAANLLKSKDGDVAKLVQDKNFAKEAMDLAAKQNDSGATTRGLGQSVLNYIKEKSLTTAPNDLGKGQVTAANYEKFFDSFNENKELLQKTLPKDQYNAIETINRELAQNSFAARTNAGIVDVTGAKDADKINDIAIKSTLSKIAGIPIGGAASIVGMARGATKERIAKVFREAISNPQYAEELMNAAKAAPKEPGAFKKTIDYLYNRLPEAAVTQTPPMDLRQDRSNGIDKEVEDVTKPQSSNSGFSFNPTSDANASELPSTGTQKKSPEIQIADASKTTGMPQEYFHALEKAETGSSVNPNTARPIDKETGKPKSSAYGLSQFTEKTWNEMASKHSLPPVTEENRYTHNDPRSNPEYSRLAAGYYGSSNADRLKPWIQSKFNRDITIGDVYGAHLMGASGFKQFMSASPNSAADKIVPQAAKNNKSLFYDTGGRALSIREVYHNIEDRLVPTKSKATSTSDGESDMEPFE